MQKKISISEYKTMPWKNGLGVTAQIALVPEGASFPEGDFLWRLSSATVRTSSAFSLFPGCDRLLVVWKGEGLKLNGKLLLPNEPLRFSGEEPIDCELLGDEVIDVGLIFDHAKVQAEMTTEVLSSGPERNIKVDQGEHYLFCGEGGFIAQDLTIQEGETLHLTSGMEIKITSLKGCRYFHIQVRSR